MSVSDACDPPPGRIAKSEAFAPPASHVVAPAAEFENRSDAGPLLTRSASTRASVVPAASSTISPAVPSARRTWSAAPGFATPTPTAPEPAIASAFVGAPAMTLNGVRPAVSSTSMKRLAPLLGVSFAWSAQSFDGKPAATLVSSNLIRRLFSFNRSVSKPKLSLFDAIEADAFAALHDQVVGDHLVGERRSGRSE